MAKFNEIMLLFFISIFAASLISVESQCVKRETGHVFIHGSDIYYENDATLWIDTYKGRMQVISFVYPDGPVSHNATELAIELKNGSQKRDWSDTIQETWVFSIFKVAAIITGFGLTVKALDFAYDAVLTSKALVLCA